MALGSASNILIGAANFLVGSGVSTGGVDSVVSAIKTAATGTPKDFRAWAEAHTSVGTALGATGVTLYKVGYTNEGVEVDYNPDYGEVDVDQLLDAARLFKQKMSVSVKTTLAEATLENLVFVWDLESKHIASAGAYKELYLVPGELGDAPNERTLVFVGNAPTVSGTKRDRLYCITNTVQMEASSHGLKRDSATVFPVSFRALPDGASSYSAYGKIVDVIT